MGDVTQADGHHSKLSLASVVEEMAVCVRDEGERGGGGRESGGRERRGGLEREGVGGREGGRERDYIHAAEIDRIHINQ